MVIEASYVAIVVVRSIVTCKHDRLLFCCGNCDTVRLCQQWEHDTAVPGAAATSVVICTAVAVTDDWDYEQ